MPTDAYYNDSNCCCVVSGDGTAAQPYDIRYCHKHEERPAVSQVMRRYLGRALLFTLGGRYSR